MSENDLTPAPALPDRAKSLRWGYYAIRVLLVAALLGAAAALPTGGGSSDRWRYREGDIARERVVAPYDFSVQKDDAALRREQEDAATAVPPVFVADPKTQSEQLARYALFLDKASGIVGDTRATPAQKAERLRALGVTLSETTVDVLATPAKARRALDDLSPWLAEVVNAGIVAEKRGQFILGYRTVSLREGEAESPAPASRFLEKREALDLIERHARAAFGTDARLVQFVREVASPFAGPSVVYDRAGTEWRRVQAQGAISGVIGAVKKDELIVDANERISREALLELRSLRNLEEARRDRSEFLYPPVARMLLMLLFIAAFATYLRMELPGVYRDNNMLALFTLLTVVTLGATVGLVSVAGLSEFTVPLAVAPLVVASLLEKRPALVFTLVLAVLILAIAELRAPYVPVAVMGGVTAVYSVSRLRHRWHFIRAFFAIGLANLAAILAWDLARTSPGPVVLKDAMWGGVNAFLATSLAFLLLPLVEHVFRLTSDITLLELSDLNRPLLRRMQLEAPGTYHHSMIVGSLAESAAEAVGANSLLARVSAYYHDVGKLPKPEYYAENEPASATRRKVEMAVSLLFI